MIADPNSGLRIFEKRIGEEFFEFLCGAFSFTTGLTILAAAKPYFIKFIPVHYRDRKGKSKVRHIRDSFRTLLLIIQGVTYYNPLKFFLFMSFCIVAFVAFPAMLLACFYMLTLSLYFMIFGCTVALLLGLGVVGDIIRVSAAKSVRFRHACHKPD